MNIKYSIIIAAYNVDKYIKKCVNSILNQSFRNIEIIIVDDASSDNTLSVIRRLAKKDKRIKVISSQSNMGSSWARNIGIKAASGEYCFIIDADDWIDREAIKNIDGHILNFGKVDVIKFRLIYEPLGQKSEKYKICNRLLSDSELKQLRKNLLLTNKYNNLANQVFRRSLYKIHDGGPRIDFGEDLVTNLSIFEKAKNVLCINDALYHYRRNNNGSTTSNVSLKKISSYISDNIKVCKIKLRYARKFGLNKTQCRQIKNRPLVFACNQIGRYISFSKVSPSELERCIEDSGLYGFIATDDFTNVGGVDGIIYKSILKRDFNLLKKYRIIITIRLFFKKIKRRFNANEKSNL